MHMRHSAGKSYDLPIRHRTEQRDERPGSSAAGRIGREAAAGKVADSRPVDFHFVWICLPGGREHPGVCWIRFSETAAQLDGSHPEVANQRNLHPDAPTVLVPPATCLYLHFYQVLL